jgi:hypothetical protein
MEKFQINIVVQELEEIFENYKAFNYDFRDALKYVNSGAKITFSDITTPQRSKSRIFRTEQQLIM